jgi:asparagine synthase (glutamine-hydrolysing)
LCGIVGAYHLNDEPVSAGFLEEALERLQHRGPDEQGYLQAGPVGLGHRRLKIIDLRTGRQPFVNEDETVWLVLSGEIYNYVELRASLEQSGHRFRSRTDAEVALHLYEEMGTGFLQALRGMFAIALWDSKRRILLLARDRLGIQPLYYHWKEGKYLLFASECKALFCHPALREIQLHDPAIYKYLLLRYVPGPSTLYKDVYKLPPGHRLVLKQERLETEPYWDLPDNAPEGRIDSGRQTGAPCKDELLSRMEESVRLHLHSDVPLGVLLSGGLDSTALVAMVHRLGHPRIRTYSIGFPVPSYDETGDALHVANLFNTEHTTERMEPEHFMEALPKLIRFRDSPLAEASEVPLYHIVRAASAEVKVLLTGQGADELFGGYLKYIAEPLVQSLRSHMPARMKECIAPLRRIVPRRPRSLQELVTYLTIEPALERWVAYFSSWIPNELATWLEHVEGGGGTPKDLLEEFQPLFRRDLFGSVLDRMMLLDLKFWLPDNLLEGGDRMSMAASVESRLPYLDHPLVEYVWGLPGRHKVKGFKTKALLRKSMKGIVPDRLLQRRKNGFAVPFGIWLRDPLREKGAQIILSSSAFHRDFLPPDVVPRIWKEHQSGIRDHRKVLWTLLNLEIWHATR